MNKYFLLAVPLLLILLASMPKAFTVPAGVTSIQNISINNQQATALPAGQQVRIVVNTIALNQYVDGGADNLEIFNGITGNVLYQWQEGNTIKPLQAPTNTIANYSIWVTLPASIAASTNAVNVLTIGFLPIGTSALNGNNVGIAPYLTSTYGQYDNGANVFTTYQAWGGLSSLPTGWTQTNGAGTTITFGTTNTAISSPVATSFNGIWWGITNSLPYSYNTPANVLDVIANVQKTSAGIQGFGLQGTLGAVTLASGQFYVFSFQQSASVNLNFIGQASNTLSPNSMVLGNTLIYSQDMVSTTTGNFQVSYNTLTALTNLVTGNPLKYGSGARKSFYFGNRNAAPMFLYVTRTRTLFPNDVPPNQINGTVQAISSYTSPSSPTLTLSNTLIDQGQSILFTATVQNGQQPYTYNYIVQAYNVLTSSNVVIANMLFTGNAFTSNSWFWTPPANLYVGNSLFNANVQITDNLANSVNTIFNGFGYNAVLAVTISPTVVLLTTGQSQLFTGNIFGGTSPYTYNWLEYNGLGLITNALYIGNQYTQNQLLLTFPYIGNYYVNLTVEDSATVNTFANTINAIIEVSSTTTSTTTSTSTSTTMSTTSTTMSTTSSTTTSVTTTIMYAANAIYCVNNVPTNVLSNTIAQNDNASQIAIFTDSKTNIEGGFGPTNTVFEVVNTITTVNISSTLIVPSKYYISYIYTGTPVFHCVWLSASGGASNIYITATDEIGIAALAIALLSGGLAMAALALNENKKSKKQKDL